MDIARIDKLKSKTPEGSMGYIHLCGETDRLIIEMINKLTPIVARLA
jgi:hypothetical protein